MGFVGSYLWRLRQSVGHDLVLVPGSSVVVLDEDGAVLLLHRSDDGDWCLPGGGAEEGSSFRSTAQAELQEESGIEVALDDLVPFATVSEPDVHVLTYPNGDVSHCFAMLFAVVDWAGDESELRCDEESTELRFFARDALPAPLAPATRFGLELYDRFVATGQFQAR